MVKRIQAVDCLALRHQVLRPHQPPENSKYPLDEEPTSAHFGYFNEKGEIVCVASLYLEGREGGPKKAFRLRGMATRPDLQGSGLGRQVLGACQSYVQQQGGDEIWCNARTTASEFYFKNGFVSLTPEPFDLPGLGPHYIMNYSIGEKQ